MHNEVIISASFLYALRDELSKAQDPNIDAAYVCGKAHSALCTIIKKLEKEKNENEENV